MEWRCAWCGNEIPAGSRSDAKFCSKACRQASWRFGVAPCGILATDRAMRFAYADPPYPGKAKYYPEKTEVDHASLIGRLATEYPDGWALICPNCIAGDHAKCLGHPCPCGCLAERRDRAARTTKAGMRRARRRGRRIGRPSLEIDGNDIVRLRARGRSLREIAAELGASKSWIAAWLKRRRR